MPSIPYPDGDDDDVFDVDLTLALSLWMRDGDDERSEGQFILDWIREHPGDVAAAVPELTFDAASVCMPAPQPPALTVRHRGGQFITQRRTACYGGARSPHPRQQAGGCSTRPKM